MVLGHGFSRFQTELIIRTESVPIPVKEKKRSLNGIVNTWVEMPVPMDLKGISHLLCTIMTTIIIFMNEKLVIPKTLTYNKYAIPRERIMTPIEIMATKLETA